MRIIALTIFCLLAVGTSAAQESFTFQPQQSVYIVAVRGNIGDPSMSTLDLAAEKDIREGFEKRATFHVVPSLSKADFVFLCITEYKENVKARVLLNVLAIALRPDDFKNNRSDLTQLRDFALWQSARSAKVRVKFKSVMADFHDFAMKK